MMNFCTIENIYNMFINTTFCESQDVVIRVHRYADYDAYEESDDSYLYHQACECESFRLAQLYNDEKYREYIFNKYDAEVDCSYISAVIDETIYIDCEYVSYNKEC